MMRTPLNLSKPEIICVVITGLLGLVLDYWSIKIIPYLMPFGLDIMVVTWDALRIGGNLLMAGAFAFVTYRILLMFQLSGFTYKGLLSIIVCVTLALFIVGGNLWRYSAAMNFMAAKVNVNRPADTNRVHDSKPSIMSTMFKARSDQGLTLFLQTEKSSSEMITVVFISSLWCLALATSLIFGITSKKPEVIR